jgi:hypothetical protein
MIADVATPSLIENEGPAPEDLATADYQRLLPQFEKRVEDLSLKQSHRILKMIMAYPFQTTQPSFTTQKEVSTFNLGLEIMDCKYVLMQAVHALGKKKVQELVHQEMVAEAQELIKQEKKEEENGS